MARMYPHRSAPGAGPALRGGDAVADVSRDARDRASSILRALARRPVDAARSAATAPRAASDAPLATGAYAALLGLLPRRRLPRGARRAYFDLRVSCDAAYPEHRRATSPTACARSGRAGPSSTSGRPGSWSCRRHWKHWPCLFPQHGPGRKHERPIVLEDVAARDRRRAPRRLPARAVPLRRRRGCANWATRMVAGERTRYDYPRWQFTQPLRRHPRAVLLGARPRGVLARPADARQRLASDVARSTSSAQGDVSVPRGRSPDAADVAAR